MSIVRTLNQAGTFTVTTVNGAGAILTPDATPTVTLHTDTGRSTGTVTLTVTGSAGTYTAAYTAGQALAANRYIKVAFTVSGTAVSDVNDDITWLAAGAVVDEMPVTVADVAAAIPGLDPTDFENTDAIEDMIRSAADELETYVGPVVPRLITERLTPVGGVLFLSKTPVVSVTSITEYSGATGTVLTEETIGSVTGTYLADLGAGLVYRRSGGSDTTWTVGQRNVLAVYTAGHSPIPHWLSQAVIELVRHRWTLRHHGSSVAFDSLPAGDFGGLPNSVKNLIRGHELAPAIA